MDQVFISKFTNWMAEILKNWKILVMYTSWLIRYYFYIYSLDGSNIEDLEDSGENVH